MHCHASGVEKSVTLRDITLRYAFFLSDNEWQLSSDFTDKNYAVRAVLVVGI